MYASIFVSKQHLANPSWGTPSLTLSLEPLLKNSLLELIQKTASALERGRLHRPLDKYSHPKSRSSRSASASASTSAAPHREHSPLHWLEEPDPIENLSRDCSFCEESSDEMTWTDSEEGYGTVSSSESDIAIVLRKEAKRTLEKNKEFLRSSRESSTSSTSRKDPRYFLEDFTGKEGGYSRGGFYYMHPEMYYRSPTTSPLTHHNLALAELTLSKKNSSPVKAVTHLLEDDITKADTEDSPNLKPAAPEPAKKQPATGKKKSKAKKNKPKKEAVQGQPEKKKGKQQLPKPNKHREFEEDRYFSLPEPTLGKCTSTVASKA